MESILESSKYETKTCLTYRAFLQSVSITPLPLDVLVIIAKKNFSAFAFARPLFFFVQEKSHRVMLSVIATMRIFISVDCPGAFYQLIFLLSSECLDEVLCKGYATEIPNLHIADFNFIKPAIYCSRIKVKHENTNTCLCLLQPFSLCFVALGGRY
jgi:hypothetical protein